MFSKSYTKTNRNFEIRNTILANVKSCRACRNERNLVVHHLRYPKFGDEERDDVTLLCSDCHNMLHYFVKGSDPDLARLTKLFLAGNLRKALIKKQKMKRNHERSKM